MKNNTPYTNIKYQISHNTKLLFIGTNPSPGTYRRGVPFSNNKSFWYLLRDAGIIHEQLSDLKNDKILKKIFLTKFTKIYNLGLINLVFRPTKTIAEIKKNEALPGRLRILRAIKKYNPRVVCFIGKGTYELFAQIQHGSYGWQDQINNSKVFVMHSPLHGLASIRVAELNEVAQAAGL